MLPLSAENSHPAEVHPTAQVDPFRPLAGMVRIIAWGWIPTVEQVHLYTVRGVSRESARAGCTRPHCR